MIASIVIILLFVLFIFIGYRRGAAVTLLNLVAVIIASALTGFLSNAAAQAVYTNFMRASVVEKLQGFITQSGGQFAAENSLKALPDSISAPLDFLAKLCGTTTRQIQGRLVTSTQQTAELVNTIEKPLGEICVFFIGMLFSVIFFIILMIVFKLLIRAILGVFELPVIRTVNRVFGALVGALEGIVIIFCLVNVIYVIMSYTNPALLGQSAVFGGLFDALAVFQ